MKRLLKNLVKIFIFLGIFTGAQALVKYMLLDDTMTISRVMIHDLYAEEKNIDVLFCGASHCQLGFDTEVLDQKLGLNTFNAGSSSQGLETSLALIKEASHNNDLKQVYVDLDYSIVMRELPNLESIYIVSDYMKPSLRKVEFLLNATTFDYYVNSFMPLHKDRGYTKNPKKIIELLKKKLQPGYWQYTERDPSYAGKGHIASSTVMENGKLWSQDEPEMIDFTIPERQQEYLKEIITFCKKNGIQLTFVSTPVTDFNLAFVENYDDYVRTVKDFLKDYQVEYYDFNLCNPELLKLSQSNYFNDDNHLNQEGAEYFCDIFSDFFTGKLTEQELFCESYREKLEIKAPAVLGVEVHLEGEELEVIPVVNNNRIRPICEIQREEDTWYIAVSVDDKITNQIEIRDEDLK